QSTSSSTNGQSGNIELLAEEGTRLPKIGRKTCKNSVPFQLQRTFGDISIISPAQGIKFEVVFFDGQTKKKVGDRQVESLSIFKKGISPEWEDPANQSGGEWTCRKNLDPNVLNTYWENLVLGLIGETIDDADEICGARVVDKSKGDRPIYRLELWVRGKDRKTADKLRDKMIEVMGEEVNPRIMPEFTFKGH
ncbi:unnamed protein product, partial [Heterosigma akashiwo]